MVPKQNHMSLAEQADSMSPLWAGRRLRKESIVKFVLLLILNPSLLVYASDAVTRLPHSHIMNLLDPGHTSHLSELSRNRMSELK